MLCIFDSLHVCQPTSDSWVPPSQVKMVMALQNSLKGVYPTDVSISNVISQTIAGVNAPAVAPPSVANPTLNNNQVSANLGSQLGTGIEGVRLSRLLEEDLLLVLAAGGPRLVKRFVCFAIPCCVPYIPRHEFGHTHLHFCTRTVQKCYCCWSVVLKRRSNICAQLVLLLSPETSNAEL